MARVIDAGVFGKALSEWCSREFDYFKATYGATPKVVSDTLRKVINMLADQPTLDYAPVRHGEWLPHADHATCSVCFDDCWADSVMGYDYCPNCGAKMGGMSDG